MTVFAPDCEYFSSTVQQHPAMGDCNIRSWMDCIDCTIKEEGYRSDGACLVGVLNNINNFTGGKLGMAYIIRSARSPANAYHCL